MEKARGQHPHGVTAHYITPEEKARMMAGSRQATIETRIITAEQKAASSDQGVENIEDKMITGAAAYKVALNVGSDHLWLTENGDPIALVAALELIKTSPNSVYFDFGAFQDEAIPETDEQSLDIDDEEDDDDEDEEGEEYETENDGDAGDKQIVDEDKYTEGFPDEPEKLFPQQYEPPFEPSPQEPPKEKPWLKGQNFGPKEIVPFGARQIAPGAVIVPQPPPDPTPAQKTGNPLVTSYLAPHTNRKELPLEERRMFAWGGTLSSPGVQVYMHPSGIVRVDIDGKVKLQTGVNGNIRVVRIARVEPQSPVSNVTQSPNPATIYRQKQERIPIPQPPKAKLDEGSEF